MRVSKKKIIWGFVFLILIAGGILCKIRWKVWFYNIPEISYVLTNEPQRVILTFGNNGELSRNVSWVCGGISKEAKLEYTKIGSGDTLLIDGSSKFLKTLGGFGYANWAKFKNLAYGDSYSYRVWNDDRASDWYSFTMQPDSTDHFSFIFIGDVQDTLRGKTRDFIENVRNRFPQTDFYMFAGDFVERPMNCYWEEAYRSVDSIAPSKPLLVSPGNHEYVKGIVRTLEQRFNYSFSYLLESEYKNNNVFSIDYKDATIITLDTNRDPWFLFSQREWLEKTLKNSDKKWKIVMLHHPVYSIKGKTNNLPVRWMFDSLFREYGVDLVLQGHEHNYARMTNKESDGKMTIPVYLVSHASPKGYRLEFNDKYDRFGTNHRFYQNIDVKGDTLHLEAFLENDSLYDDIQIVKNASGILVLDRGQDIPEILEMPWLTGKKAEEFEQSAEKWRKRSLVQ
ncbi:metallophosphoesterase family protein [Bacteroides sp.]|uniref:purple acid phosphatase family protein n=1 Tax=Bacteroides sp. TaxID=29523 RepID=UPI002602E871|nr:metallophosphoesterase family protein [Bacteroides sp.]MDD3039661.1 metallophosphoesterase family protein [Bacteroides sp.]